MNEIRVNLILVVSADAVSWESEVDSYGRNRPVQRAWIVVPAVWPGDVTLKIRPVATPKATSVRPKSPPNLP